MFLSIESEKSTIYSKRNYFPHTTDSLHTDGISGFCRLLSGWPAGLAVIRAGWRGEWPGSSPAYVILYFSVTFHFQLNYSF